jgi:hypothetical protein
MSQALIDKLSEPKYTNLSDQAAADAINALTVTVRKPVDLWQVEEHASRKGYRAKLERASKTEGHPCQEVALNILAYINSARLNTVDMDLADTQLMIGAMVQCQFATQAMADELVALADQTIKWTESVGLPEIGVGLVQNARKKMGVQ